MIILNTANAMNSIFKYINLILSHIEQELCSKPRIKLTQRINSLNAALLHSFA